MTWDSSVFPTPERMQKDLASRGERKMVAIVDPHVKRDPFYRVHKEATDLGFYVRNAQGGEFDGWCWPGEWAVLARQYSAPRSVPLLTTRRTLEQNAPRHPPKQKNPTKTNHP